MSGRQAKKSASSAVANGTSSTTKNANYRRGAVNQQNDAMEDESLDDGGRKASNYRRGALNMSDAMNRRPSFDDGSVASTSLAPSTSSTATTSTGFSLGSKLRKKYMPKFSKKKKRSSDPGETASVGSSASKGSIRSDISTATAPTIGRSASFTKSRFMSKAAKKAAQAAAEGGYSNNVRAPLETIESVRGTPTKGEDLDVPSGDEEKSSSQSVKPRNRNNGKRPNDTAKSCYNVGLIYLKTKNYRKAIENLKSSLDFYSQMQDLYVEQEEKQPTAEILAMATVRKTLGECYENCASEKKRKSEPEKAIIDDYKSAIENYEGADRLLKSIKRRSTGVSPQENSDAMEMHGKIDDKLQELNEIIKQYEKKSADREKKVRPPAKTLSFADDGQEITKRPSRRGLGERAFASRRLSDIISDKSAKYSEDGATTSNADVGVTSVASNDASEEEEDPSLKESIVDTLGLAVRSTLDISENPLFKKVMINLKQGNHRAALKETLRLQGESNDLPHDSFRPKLVECLLRVGDSAMRDGNTAVATDAYEVAVSIEKQDDSEEIYLKPAMRGCIKGHKLQALQMEKKKEFDSAISHRRRIHDLLMLEKRRVPACQQLVMIAYLQGQMEKYEDSVSTLSEATERLAKRVKVIELMPRDKISLYIRCYLMEIVCHTNMKNWDKAVRMYDELLPLVSRWTGENSKEYSSLIIQYAVLSMTMGEHDKVIEMLNEYFERFEKVENGLSIVSADDHLLALDVCAASHLKLDSVDDAIAMSEKMLEFVNTLDGHDEMKSEAMHKLGCLLASNDRQEEAMPLLSGALRVRKSMDDGGNLWTESAWAVATTRETLGQKDRSIDDYGLLLEGLDNMNDKPSNSSEIYNSAGKLYFEEGSIDKAVTAFRNALNDVGSSGNHDLKSSIMLNLANALAARSDFDEALKFYNDLAHRPSIRGKALYYLSLYNKSLLLIKMGEGEKAKPLLLEVIDSRSAQTREVRGKANLTLGNVLVSEGAVKEALRYFDDALGMFTNENWDLNSVVQAKKNIGMAYAQLGQYGTAMTELGDALEDVNLPKPEDEEKNARIKKAEIWNCMGRVCQKKGDISSAIKYSELALQIFKRSLGQFHPNTLRGVSNMSVLMMEEARSLSPSESKDIIHAAKLDMEETLDAFLAFDEPWVYSIDVATLFANLSLLAVRQGKPKRARKMLGRAKEIVIPPNHELNRRIAELEKRVIILETPKQRAVPWRRR